MIYTDLIYDFDGTIGDTYPIFTESLLMLLERHGLSDTYEHALALLKVSVGHALSSYEFDADKKAISDEHTYLREPLMVEKALPMEGAAEILKFVKENGGRNYIYTHSPNYIWTLLEKWGLRDYFEGGVTADNDFPRKPAPDALNYIVEKYGLDRSKCLMVGDRDIDIDVGHNAGMKGILLDPDDFYADYRPDFRVTRLTEIKDIIV